MLSKSQRALAIPRRSTLRTWIPAVALLVTLALVSGLAWGCGSNDSATIDLSPATAASAASASAANGATGTASATTTPVGRAGRASVVHARVMTEHRLRMAAVAAAAATSTTSTSPPQPEPPASAAEASALSATTAVVLAGGQTPLKGVWSGTADRLSAFLIAACPTPRFTVPVSVLAGYYVRYCAESGLRADLLWAQMMHETGYGMYGGDVKPEQNNYAGIGATGGGEPGVYFPTAEAGVMAHVAHMVAYVYASSPIPWAEHADPRFYFVSPRGAASVLADLNGRWAVPGPTYGESIEGIARAINAD